MPEKKSFQDLISDWSRDAEKFVREALMVEKITKQQQKALAELTFLVNSKIKASENRESCSGKELEYARKRGISIMAGRGVGKDTFAAWAVLWFLCCFPYPKIPCTAPTAHQLKDILWAEISKWIRHSNKAGNSFVNDVITWNSESVYMNQVKSKKPGGEWYAVARTCNTKASAEEQAETLSGFHEDYQMFVVDEASAVPDPVFKPIEGTLTGACNFALVIFNPTRSVGFALRTQQQDRKEWITLQWNAEESEIVSQDQIEYMRKKYGRDSNAYRISVLGLPPKSDDDGLIKWDWIQDAIDREVDTKGYKDKIGIDVGGGGDKSIFLNRTGYKVRDMAENRNEDTMVMTGWTAEHLKDFDRSSCEVMIDIVGIGRGVYDRLREIGFSWITGVNVSNSAFHPDRFSRLRDELWWRMRESFERGEISIPNDDELISELSVVKYETDSNGKIKVESKKDLRRRNVPSPNKADALALTFYFEEVLDKKKAIKDRWAKDYGEDDFERMMEKRANSWMRA